MNKNDNNKSGKSGRNDQGSTKKDFNRDSGKSNSISNTAPPPRRPPPKGGSDGKK